MHFSIKYSDTKMRCNYCDKPVLGSNPITVAGIGSAHVICHQTRLTSERIFGSLNMTKLDDHQLNELSDMVIMERNARSVLMGASNDNFEIELF